jgi:arylsulfatase A-like enzyme
VFIGTGPSFNTGTREAKLTDIVPTILYAMGEPIPRRTDGEVLNDIMTVDRSPEYEDTTGRSWTDHAEAGEDDDDRRDQLEALGYLQ